MPGPFWQPEISPGENGEQRAGDQYVMEVRHHVIGILELNIDGGDRTHQTGETAHREHKQKAAGEEHWRLERHRAFPHSRDPVEDLHAGRHRDQHGGEHEE